MTETEALNKEALEAAAVAIVPGLSDPARAKEAAVQCITAYLSRRPSPAGDDVEELTEEEHAEVKDVAMSLASSAVHHLETMYPAALKAVPTTARTSLRNHILNEATSILTGCAKDIKSARAALAAAPGRVVPEELRKLSGDATAGPWKVTALPGGWDGVKSERWGIEICALKENTPVNAPFIAAAVNFVRDLIHGSTAPPPPVPAEGEKP